MSISGVSGGAQMVRSFQPPTFSSLDANSSGGITLEELTSGAPAGASDSKSAERAKKLFEAMDTDKSGSITSTEKDAFDSKMEAQRSAMQFTAQLFGSGQPPSNDEVFAATDKDSDGSVSLAEFSDSEGAEGVSSDELEKLFGLIDSDGDGAISETESATFLDDVKSAAAGSGGPMGGPPPGGGPGGPGGPPPGGGASATEEDEEDETTSILDLLSAATKAYSANSQNDDLLSTLSSIFDQAA